MNYSSEINPTDSMGFGNPWIPFRLPNPVTAQDARPIFQGSILGNGRILVTPGTGGMNGVRQPMARALRNPMGKGGAGSGSGGPVEKRRRRRGRGRGHCQVFPTLLYIDTPYTHRTHTHTHTHTRGGVEGVEEPEASAGRGLLFLPLFIFSWFLLLQLPRRFLLPFSKSTGSNMQMRRIPQRLPIRPGSTCQFLPPINNCFISNGLLFISCAGGNVVYNYEIVSVNPMEMMRVSAFQIHFPPPSQKKKEINEIN